MYTKTYSWLNSKLWHQYSSLAEVKGIKDYDQFIIEVLRDLAFLRALWSQVKYDVRDVLDDLIGFDSVYTEVMTVLDALLNEGYDDLLVILMGRIEENNRLGVMWSLYEYMSNLMRTLESSIGLRYRKGGEVSLWDVVGWVVEYQSDVAKTGLTSWIRERYQNRVELGVNNG